MKKIYTSILLIGFLCLGKSLIGQATLPLSRTSWGLTAPTGWTGNLTTQRTSTFACSGSDGGSLQSTTSYYRVNFNSTPATLTYNLKGSNPTSGSYKVQESADGVSWNDVAAFTTISGSTCQAQSHSLLSSSRFVQFIYISKTTGNVDIDDVSIVGPSIPTITPSPTTLTGLTYQAGFGPSAAQSFSLAASNLTAGGGTITIAESTNYQVSTTSATAGFGASATLTYTGTGALATNTVWVRLKSGRAIGPYNTESIGISGGGATSAVTVSGNVTVAVFTSVAGSDWNTAATWDKIAVPGPDDNVVIDHAVTLNAAVTRNLNSTTTVNAGKSLAVSNGTYTNNGTTTINGTFQLNTLSYATGNNFVYGAAGSLVFNSGSLYGVTPGQAFWPGIAPPFNVTVNTGSSVNLNNASRTVAGTLSLFGGFENQSGLLINGTLLINTGGYVSINGPRYNGASLLRYNSSPAAYGRGLEWTVATGTLGTTGGYPNDVQLSGNTTLDVPNTGVNPYSNSLGMARDLTIDAGSSLYMDYGGSGNKSGSLVVGRHLVMNGNLSLGNAIGGDLSVAGNWTKGVGTFTHNSRQVTFNGTVAQVLTGATDFAYLKINNSTGISLAGNVSAANEVDFTLGKITLGTNNLTLASGASVANVTTAAYVVTNSTGRYIKNQLGNTATLIPVGTAATYTPLTITNTGTINNISVNVKSPVTTAPSDPAKIVDLEWSVLSGGAGAVANIIYQWNAANQATSFVPTAASEVSNYQSSYSVVGTGTPSGSNPYTLGATGLAIATSGTNLYIVANSCASNTPAQPGAFISPITSINAPASGVVYSVPGVSGVYYTWSYSGSNVNIVSAQGTNSITLDFLAGATGGTLTVTPSIGTCTGTARTLTIAMAPVNDLCANAITLSLNAAPISGTLVSSGFVAPFAKKDVWYKFTTSCSGSHVITVTGFTGDVDVDLFNQGSACPTSVTTIANAAGSTGTETITVNLSAGTIYYVRVFAFSAGADNANFTIAASTTVVPLGMPGGITGSTSPCANSSQNYSITAVVGADDYTWSFPGGDWVVTAGAGTTTVTVTAGTSSGNVAVTANNGCGSSPARTLAVSPLPIVTAPQATAGTFITSNSFEANWNTVAGATGYYVDVYTNAPAATDLIISEYVHGSSNHKYIEIFNGTGATVNLADYKLRLYSNGSAAFSSDVALSGTLNNNSTIVYRNNLSTIYTGATIVNAAVNFNGNDAVVLFKISANANVDIFGRIGNDPGTAWSLGGNTTLDKTLVRGPNVLGGVTVNPTGTGTTAFTTLGTEWIQFNQDVVSNLGTHSFNGGLIFVPGFQNVFTVDNILDVTGLNPSTTYYYVVRAEVGGCVSANSNQIAVTTLPPCVPDASITSFNPAQGPVGTRVTIFGTNLGGATSVKFGSAEATSFTVDPSGNNIIAQVPANAAFDFIKVLGADNCTAASSAKFTLNTNNGACGTGSGSGSNLYISEIYDASSGTLTYVEIFNPTTVAIPLNNYTLRIRTVGSGGGSNISNYSLSSYGNISGGAVKVFRLGTSSPLCSSITATSIDVNASGMNGNDQVILVQGSTVIDLVNNPNYGGGSQPGFSQVRKPTAIGPTATYTASDWVISTNEDCSHLTVAPFQVSSANVTINSHPADVTCANVINLSVNATSSTGNYNYTWYYNDPTTMNGWLTVSSLNATTYGIAGVGTANLTLSNNVGALTGYQFYVTIASGGTGQCVQTSNAAHFKPDSKLFYRSIGDGSWTAASTWEMKDANTAGGWIPACSYPVAANCNEIIIRNKIVLPSDITVDKITIDALASLEVNSSAKLSILNTNSGPDLIINGTFIDSSASVNSASFATGATWEIASTATFIKTNVGSTNVFRDHYETGIANIPSTANWIIRGSSTSEGGLSSLGMVYPNLTFESSNGLWNQGSTTRFSGNSGTVIVKGNLDIGGAGPGTVIIYNENYNSTPIEVRGNTIIRAGNTLTNIPTTVVGKDGVGFDLKGNLTVNGSLLLNTPDTGLLRLSGGTVQTISGTGRLNIFDLEINNTSGASAGVIHNMTDTVFNSLSILGTSKLQMAAGTTTLRSTLQRTAGVATIPATAGISYVTGSFVVERSLLLGKKWRLLAAPTNRVGQTVRNSWQENAINNPGYGFIAADTRTDWAARGFDQRGGNSSVKMFDRNNQNWLGVDNTNASSINAQAGYFVFVAGDRSVTTGPSNTTNLRTSGAINIGDSTISIPAGKYDIIGNRYASRINIENFTFSNLDFSFAVWDPSITSYYGLGAWNYLYKDIFDNKWKNLLNSGIYGAPNTENKYIESGMAFMAKAGAVTGTFTFTEGSKAAGSFASEFVPGTMQGINVKLNLAAQNGNDAILLDGILANFDASLSNNLDHYDIRKMSTVGEELSLSSNGSFLAIERRSNILNTDTLHLTLSRMRAANYQWDINSSNMDFPGRTGFLIDRYLNTSTQLNLAGVTTVNFNVVNIAGSYAADRFKIVFNQPDLGPLPVTITTVTATRKADKTIDVAWKVEDEINISSYEVQRSANGSNFSSIHTRTGLANNAGTVMYNQNDALPLAADNFYRIKANSVSGQVQYSAVVKVSAVKEKASISVYPNPVEGRDVQLRFTGQPAGKYQVQITNAIGQVLYNATVTVSSAMQTQRLSLPAKTAAGSYQLKVIAQDGQVSVQQLFLQ